MGNLCGLSWDLLLIHLSWCHDHTTAEYCTLHMSVWVFLYACLETVGHWCWKMCPHFYTALGSSGNQVGLLSCHACVTVGQSAPKLQHRGIKMACLCSASVCHSLVLTPYYRRYNKHTLLIFLDLEDVPLSNTECKWNKCLTPHGTFKYAREEDGISHSTEEIWRTKADLYTQYCNEPIIKNYTCD